MRLRSLLFLVFCLVWPALRLQAQEDSNTKALIDEEDARIASVAARQSAVTNLLTTGYQNRDAGDELKAARAWNRAGRLQLQLNQPDAALATFRNALKLLPRTPVSQIRIDSLNGVASVYKHSSQCLDAKRLLRQAISLSGKIDYVEGEAEAYLASSECQEDKSVALENAQEALELWQSMGHKLGIARAYLVVGEFQMVQNQLLESAESFETARELWRELNVPRQVAQALINLGYIEWRKGAWQASLSFYVQAEQLIDEEAEPYMMGQIQSGLAEAFLESGLEETGLVKYRESLEYFRATGSPRAMVGIEWGIGRAHYLLGNYSEAIAILSATRTEALAINELMTAALCDDFLGRTYYALNDHAAALRHYEAALQGFITSGNPMETARTLALMGQVHQQQGNFKKAKANYQQALARFRKLSDQVNESATLYALGALELKQNAVAAAEEYLRQSIEMTEKMRRVSTSVDLTAAFSAKVHERYEKYIDCMMRKHKASGTEDLAIRAFETSEQARARALTELLHATQANLFPDLDPEIARREKSLRESLQINENAKVALLSSKYRRAELAALDAEHLRLKAEHDRVSEEIRARNPGYEQIIKPTAWNLQSIQQQVLADDQTTLLEYSLGAEKSYLWVVTRSEIKSYELPNEATILAVADRVSRLLEQAPLANTDNELSGAVQQLAQMILAPASERLKSRRLIIVPDGVLHYIPFQVLPLVENEPLVASKEIVNAPSASILGDLHQEAARRQPATNVLAAFGDPVFASDQTASGKENNGQQLLASARLRSALRGTDRNGGAFGPAVSRLFHAKRELESLRELGGDGVLIASEYAATREQFLKTDLTQYAMLHFATHGFFLPERPESSGLLLSNINPEGKQVESFVGLQEIYELRAPVQLVVLSACQTALGKDVRGEGLLGLTRGFMYAGASSVVASLWRVDDGATAELMKHFYSNMLQRQMKPAEALRAAQNSIRQQSRWRSPYYWAGFTLQGEYDQVIKPASQTGSFRLSWQAAGFALLLLLTSLVWWYRRRRGLGAGKG